VDTRAAKRDLIIEDIVARTGIDEAGELRPQRLGPVAPCEDRSDARCQNQDLLEQLMARAIALRRRG
jgi:hypothetical protein